MAESDLLILIPARMASTRLPGKPLADIAGQPMIVHVLRRAQEAALGPVAVATDSREIAQAVEKAGGQAVMTRAEHVSGSDRIFEALNKLDPQGRVDIVVNVQGDLPTLSPQDLRAVLEPLDDPEVDIATLAAEIKHPAEKTNPNVVKIVGSPISPRRLRALYFTRATAPAGDGPLYHHIGLYAYRRAALQRFVELPPSALELREKLEQLRALEAGMRIDVALVDGVPLGVDTPEELTQARALLSSSR
jgi:3-deoxy-manno-octulosonate cytidylyltransferase (CMP-KDO synthetase)